MSAGQVHIRVSDGWGEVMRRDRITIRKVPDRWRRPWRWQLPAWSGSYYEGWASTQPEALEAALAFLADPQVQALVRP